jgi:hypothetical protein
MEVYAPRSVTGVCGKGSIADASHGPLVGSLVSNSIMRFRLLPLEERPPERVSYCGPDGADLPLLVTEQGACLGEEEELEALEGRSRNVCGHRVGRHYMRRHRW